MPHDIDFWKNRNPKDQSLEELALMLKQILDYLNELDARLAAGGH